MPSYDLDTGSLPLLFGERIVFNGFVFNDHSTLERARVTAIDGLMDSDIRDSRQENPDQDGEDFFDLLRGGRTLSFDGELLAGNLHSLANLRQRMKVGVAGTDDIWFNRYDWDDDFKTADAGGFISNGFVAYSDADRITHSSSLGTLTVADPAGDTSEVFIHKPSKKATADSRMMTAITDWGGITPADWVGHCHKVIRPGTVNYANSTITPRGSGLTADLIAAVFHVSSGKFAIWRVSGGSALILAQFSISSFPSQRPLWFVTEQRGNDITFELWNADPRTDNTARVLSTLQTTLTLAGADATKYGSGVYAPTGLWLGADGAPASIKIQEHVVEGLGPSDAVFLNARRNSPIAGRESQDSYEYKRGFQFTLRSSDPMIYSRAMEFGFIYPTQVSDYGASYNWSYDINFDAPIDSAGNIVSAGTVTVKNVGDADAHPEIIFANGLLNPTFTNLTTGESLTIRGTVGDGEWKSYNMRTGYSLDSVGDDCSGLIDPSSDRVSLAPGDNVIVVTAQNYSSFGGVMLRYRSTFK